MSKTWSNTVTRFAVIGMDGIVTEQGSGFLLGLLPRHLCAGAARLRQADCDRLLAAPDLLAGSAALEGPAFALVHGLLHFLARFLAILGHDLPPLLKLRPLKRRGAKTVNAGIAHAACGA